MQNRIAGTKTDWVIPAPRIVNGYNSSMICFDVYLNGEKLCRAGKDDFEVINFIVDRLAPHDGDHLRMSLYVGGGSRLPSGGSVHLRWLDHPELKEGDEITIKIVTSDISDEPIVESFSSPESTGRS